MMIELKNLVKRYRVGRNKPDVVALKGISLKLPDVGLIFVLGKSGSGKSTFLNVVGGLDSFEGGDLELFGKSAKDFTPADYDSYRNKYVGFIFQEYNIINSFTVRRNVELAIELQNRDPKKSEVDEILSRVGLLELADRLPSQLSGGQKQRIAIARALVKHPQLVLADEPTGALDSFNTQEIFNLLKEISSDRLVVCVTHDAACAEKYADRIIRIKDGHVVGDLTRRFTDGVKLEGSDNAYQLKNGLIKVDDVSKFSENDYQAIRKETSGSTGPAYYAYGDHVRIPSELAEGDDSEDIPVGFSPTTDEDIAIRCTKNKQFKSIKSHMRSKTVATFAFGTLKSSPARLAMTIILSILSFSMLGASVTLSSYDQADTFAASSSIYHPSASVLTKSLSGDADIPVQDGRLHESDLARIKDGYSSEAIPVYRSPRASLIRNLPEGDTYKNDWFIPSFNSVAPLESLDQVSAFGFQLEGALPKLGEVVLPEYAVWYFNRAGVQIGDRVIEAGSVDASTLIGSTIKVNSIAGQKADEFTVSGILETDLTESQVEQDLVKAQTSTVDRYLLERENWENGPSKIMFFSPEQIASSDFQTGMRVEADDINRVLVPTIDQRELKNLWHYTHNNLFTAVDADLSVGSSQLPGGADGYRYVSYTIESSVASLWLDSDTFSSSITGVKKVALGIAITLAVIAILVTTNFLFTSVTFKIREIGILKGLGSSSHEIFGIFTIEAVIIAAVNFIASCLISFGVIYIFNRVFQTLFSIPLQIISFGWLPALVLFLVSFGVSILSVLIPSYSASSMKPVDAMKRGLN